MAGRDRFGGILLEPMEPPTATATGGRRDRFGGIILDEQATPQPASPPLSVPFVNQPTIDPLGDMLRTGGDLPYTPAAPPVQGLPEVQGVLDDWNLSGYVDPELTNPPSFELPKSALTPTAISDFNERKRAEEQRAEQQRMADLLSVFNGPNPGDPYKEGDRRLDSAYRNKLRSDYYGSLPYPMTEDVLAARIDPSTKHVYDRFRRLNELATGKLLLDEPQSITPEERDYRQKMIDNERAMMQARGLDPAQYLAELESFDGQQGFFGRNLAAMGNAASDVAGNIYDLATDTGGGQNVQGTRMRQQDAAWRETIEDIKDERSPLPNTFNEVARASAQATPQLAGAAAVGLATKNPALATATMLGPAALDTYQTGRASGLSDGAAVGRAIALAGVEYATMKAGGAIAGSFGGKTFEEIAFGTGAKSTKKSLLGKLVETAGSSTVEGGEEGVAAIAQQVGDHLIGLEDELVGDETPEQLALSFAVGFLAGGAMNTPQFANFIANPTAENAKAAGITEELAPTQVDRESLAAAAQARIDALSTEAPQSPADAPPPDTTSEPVVAAEVAQETAQEPELAAEPAKPVQVDSAEVPSGEYSPPVEPPRKRRLGDRKAEAVEPSQTLRRTASWVIRDKATGEVVQETFQKSVVDKINKDKYEAVPIQEYLGSLNKPAEPTQQKRRLGDRITAPSLQSETPVPSEVTPPQGQSAEATPNVASAPKEPWQMTRAEFLDSRKGDKRTTDADYDRAVWNAYFDDKISREEVDRRTLRDTQGNKHIWAKTRRELEQDKKDAITAAKKERADINKQKATKGYASWRIRSQSNTAKQNIANVEQYQQGLLDVHKDRVREAMGEGKPVPHEVLADYPDLAQPTPPRGPSTDSAEVPSGEYSPPVEPPRKRRLGDRKAAPSVTTLTGREIPAPPQITGGGERKTANQVRSQLQWLLDQGIAEAESRGDDFNLSWMRNEKVGNLSKGNGLPQATIDSLNVYLFGEQSPSWDSQTGARIESGQELSSPPPVIPPITKPLAPTPSVAPPDAPPVAPSQVTADSGVVKETGYLNGDQIEYTGVITPDGMREFVYLEGAKKGQTGVRWTEAEKNARSEQNRRDWQEQQEGFKRLREASDHIVDANKMVPEVVAPKKKLGQKRELPPILKADEFKQKLRDAATTPEEGDMLVRLVEAQAEADGESIDDYVGKVFADVLKTDRSESVYLKQLANGRGDALAQPAYHGSPYKFDKFTLDKIGTGEGHQAFGYGLYFAGNEAVARYYKEALSPGRGETPRDTAARMLGDVDSPDRRVDAIAEATRRRNSSNGREFRDHMEKVIDVLRSDQPLKGLLYKVNLKPEEYEYIDWDKPLSGQSQRIKDAVEGLAWGSHETGEDFYRSLSHGLRLGNKSERGDVQATRLLNERGVRGIRFLDQGSRDKGGGTHNYVIFDDADVVIEEVLAQKKGQLPRAEVQFLKEDGRAIIRAFREAQDLSSLLHELGHVFRRRLSAEQLAVAETWAGVKNGKWTRAAEEKFARAFERYMREGKAPTEGLKDVFAKFKKWLTSVYKTIKGSPIDVELTPEIRAVMDSLFTKKRLGQKKAEPAKVQEDSLPDWVTEDNYTLEAPALAPKQKQELSRIKRRLKAKLDAETFDEIAGMSEADQYVIASEADRRADAQNAFVNSVLDDLNNLFPTGSPLSLITRNKERAGKDASRIPGFDQKVQQLRDGGYPSLASYAESRGQGDLESGLFDILQGGKKAIQAELVGPESHAFDVLEEYRERLERSPEEESVVANSEEPGTGFDDEPVGQQRDGGDARPEAQAPTAQEADDFQLTGEGSRDTTPIVEPYKVAEKDRLPPKKKSERQPQLGGMPEDLDERVLEGQQGLFSANTGEQLQPASKPKVIVTPPKSQRQIIAELSKALDIPIRFGRQLNRQAGGVFYKVQNIITSKFANDVPVVTHEVGHKLDSMFGLSKDKKIAGELDRLGDPDTPGSRSSWTKSKSGVYKRGEGMAEFVRYWMTDPKKAKAEAPGTYEAFEAVLDANKDLGDALRQTQEDIKLWRTAEPQARLRSQISIGENPNKTRYSLSQLTRDLVDDLHYLRLASEDAKLGDPDLPPSKNPYLLARNLRGSYGMASTFIQNGAVNFKTKAVKLGSSLEDALKPVGGRINDFRDWIVAKRALELESQGRPTGLVKSDIEAVAKRFDGDADFEKAFSDLKRWNDAVLQYAVDAGLVTKEGYDAIKKMNQDYVPFHRLFEVGANEAPSSESTGKGSGLNPGKPGSLKRLKGSQRNIVDPLETMVKNAYAIITASEKSAISLAVADMAKLPNMGKWVEKVSGPMKETKFSVNDIRDQLEDMGADLEGIDEKGGDDMLSIFRLATRPPKGENTISVVRDGKTEFYRLNRYLHDTFEALDLDDAGKLVRILSAPAQVLRAGVTLEPGFNLANVMRDTVGAAVVGKYGALPFETTIRGIAALVNNPQLVSEWAASGGRSSVEANYFDRKKMQKYLAERIAKDLTPAERALVVAKSPLTALRWMATTFEEATRIGEYQKAYDSLKKSGMADGEARRLAAFEARDRQDFAKGGAKTKILRHVAAFWNAQLQANVRLAQSFKERPVQTIAKGLAFVTLPKLIEQALNWDDEDYWERPQWERDLFYMVPIGKDDAGHTRFLRIPVPFEIGVIFATIPGRFMEWAKKNDPEAVKDIPSMFLKQTVPVPNPSGAVTVLELIPDQGYSYFRGREIVPDSMADMPKDLQWTAQTSTLAKKIGQATGISPMKVDYFIESTTGGTGKVALGKQVSGERFVSNPLAVTGQPISDFYAIRDQLKEDSERMKATGEHSGLGPVMLSQFEEAGEKIGALRNKAREETDPVKKAKIENEAYQMTREMVQKYRENPEPEEAVQEYAKKQAKKAVLSSGRPQQKKKKLGSKEPPETDDEYKKRLADWEESRDSAISWLKAHKSSPAVQAAVKEVAKDIPSPPKYTGRLAPKLGAKRKEWREKYGSAAGLLELLK